MKTKIEMKVELAELVTKKVQNTQERLTLKRIPFTERTVQQHRVMLGCWDEGRYLREQIRHAGLAYAFLRGRRYWEVERFTQDGPLATLIAANADVTAEEIQAWLEVKPSEAELAAYAEHLQRAKEKARAAKLAHPRRAA